MNNDFDAAADYLGRNFIINLANEIKRARAKFPGNEHMLGALTEEVGEVAKALLEQQSTEQLHHECTQVACVAVRIIQEGDADYVGDG